MVNDTKATELPTVSSQEFLPALNLWATLGGLLLAVGCSATFVGAAFIKYNVTVKAPATVRPLGELRVVQAASEGTVASIAARENQTVERGEAIAFLADDRLQTEKLQLQGNIQQLEAQLVQLNAQISSLDSEKAAESDRAASTIAASEAELAGALRTLGDRQLNSIAEVEEAEANLKLAEKDWQRARAEYNSARAELRSDELSLSAAKLERDAIERDLASCPRDVICKISTAVEATANLRLAQEELQKLQAELKSAEATSKSIAASLEVARAQLKRYQPLIESGAISRDRLEEVALTVTQQEQALEAQKALLQAQTETIEWQEQAIEAARARLQRSLSEARLEVERQEQAVAAQTALRSALSQTVGRQEQAIEVARTRLRRARTGLDPGDTEVAVARESVALERATVEAKLARLDREREVLLQQQVEIQNQLDRDRQELKEIDRQLSAMVISAPESGIILQLNLRNTGQVVAVGDAIARIAPRDAALVVKARVESGDIGLVEVGQDVELLLSACPHTDYGTLKAEVVGISPDVIPSDRPGVGSFYEVTIRPEKSDLVSRAFFPNSEARCAIQVGMEGRADIISKKETVLQFMLRKARLNINW
jgi:multidrug efflux pump subunit AcrA (membrane-fusion protein)